MNTNMKCNIKNDVELSRSSNIEKVNVSISWLHIQGGPTQKPIEFVGSMPNGFPQTNLYLPSTHAMSNTRNES